MTPIYQQVMAANALRGRGNPQQQPVSAYPPVQQLRNQSDIGLLGIMSGYKPLQQAGAFLSSDAANSIKAMEANKLASDRQHALEKYWENQHEIAKQKADETAKYHEGMLDVQHERNQAMMEQRQGVRDERNLAKLSAAVQKSGLEQIGSALARVYDELGIQGVTQDKATGKWNIPEDIKGLGGLENYGWYTSLTSDQQGKGLNSSIAGLKNYILKVRSGAAVTSPEMTRLLQEIPLAAFDSDESFLRALGKIRQGYVSGMSSVFAGAPEVVDDYLDNQAKFGGSTFGFPVGGQAQQTPPLGGAKPSDATGMQPGMVNSYTDLSAGQSPSTVVYDTGR